MLFFICSFRFFFFAFSLNVQIRLRHALFFVLYRFRGYRVYRRTLFFIEKKRTRRDGLPEHRFRLLLFFFLLYILSGDAFQAFLFPPLSHVPFLEFASLSLDAFFRTRVPRPHTN